MGITNNATGYRPGVCTSTTRPTAPYEGQMVYETDTDMVAIWNGSAWRYIAATTPTNGTVLQVVTGSTSTETTNTTSTYADTNLTATITPKSSSSKIVIFVSQNGCYKTSGNAENRIQIKLFRGTTEVTTSGSNHLYTGTALINIGSWSTCVIDSPAVTSATTYKTQFMNPQNVSAAIVQNAGAVSTIVLMEIAG